MTGDTDGRYFPSTPGAYFSDGHIYVVKLNTSGSELIYAARLGGTGIVARPSGIALDPTGAAYITGEISNGSFPTTPGAFQDLSYVNGLAGFVSKLSPNGQTLVYSTILTGAPGPATTETSSADIAVDSDGFAYVTGWTAATSFPVTVGAFQTTLNGLKDAFVTKLAQGGDHLVFSTLLGGSADDEGHTIAVDQAGSAFIGGWPSIASFPTTPGALSPTCDTNCGGFVTKVAPGGRTLVYSTYFPQHGNTNIVDLLVDSDGRAVITGEPYDSLIPLSPGSPAWEVNGTFVTRLAPDGSTYDFSWFFGGVDIPTLGNPPDTATGIALGLSGDAFVVGSTRALIPTTPGVVQPAFGGGAWDSFVTRIHLPLAVSALTIFPASGPSLGGTPVTITGTGFQAGALVRLGGIPAVVTNVTPTSISAVTGPHPDGLVYVEVENPDGGVGLLKNGFTYVCGGTPPTAAVSGGGAVCAGQSTTLAVTLTGSGPWNLVWSDGVTQSGLASSPATRVVTPLSTTTYTILTVADTTCAGSATGSAVVTVIPAPDATLTAPARACAGVVASASIPATTGALYSWTVTNGTIVSGQGSNVLSFIGSTDPVTVSVVATLGSCSATASRTIPVSVPPSATVSGGGTICQGGSATVSFDLTGTPPFTLTWSDGAVQTVANAGPGTRSVSPSATHSYQITSLVDYRCAGGTPTGSASVTVNPAPFRRDHCPGGLLRGSGRSLRLRSRRGHGRDVRLDDLGRDVRRELDDPLDHLHADRRERHPRCHRHAAVDVRGELDPSRRSLARADGGRLGRRNGLLRIGRYDLRLAHRNGAFLAHLVRRVRPIGDRHRARAEDRPPDGGDDLLRHLRARRRLLRQRVRQRPVHRRRGAVRAREDFEHRHLPGRQLVPLGRAGGAGPLHAHLERRVGRDGPRPFLVPDRLTANFHDLCDHDRRERLVLRARLRLHAGHGLPRRLRDEGHRPGRGLRRDVRPRGFRPRCGRRDDLRVDDRQRHDHLRPGNAGRRLHRRKDG